MTIGGIYYTNNCLDPLILQICQKQIKKSFTGNIVSVSLKPIDFGQNIVLDLKPGAVTMTQQIFIALKASTADVVFYLEHDVLYHKSHFDFEPPRQDIFYYNTNNWKWKYPDNFAVTHDDLTSLSSMCVNRKWALDHYEKRLKLIEKKGWVKQKAREPYWIRRLGYEPGTKSKRQELIATHGYQCWRSPYPNIDIRHGRTFSRTKCDLGSFKHKPKNWQEATLDQIPGWNLKALFNL